jgi:hypothetical protein
MNIQPMNNTNPPKEWDQDCEQISLGLVNRLKARIARRESRLKYRPTPAQSPEPQQPGLLPAA